jgi:CheY-like chemotaxis protein
MRAQTVSIDNWNLPKTLLAGCYPLAETPATPLKILLVEDNASDAELTRISLDSTDIPYTLQRLQKGTDVIPYLTHKGFFIDKAVPDLILLDLGLPCENGFEVLEEISKLRGAVRGIPLVILTGFQHFSYLKQSHELCVTDYITKPCSTEKLRGILSRLV